MAISCGLVGTCRRNLEIATPFGLAMTVVDESGFFWFGQAIFQAVPHSAGAEKSIRFFAQFEK